MDAMMSIWNIIVQQDRRDLLRLQSELTQLRRERIRIEDEIRRLERLFQEINGTVMRNWHFRMSRPGWRAS